MKMHLCSKRGKSSIISNELISWDYNHLFSIVELDSTLPRGGRDFMIEEKGMS